MLLDKYNRIYERSASHNSDSGDYNRMSDHICHTAWHHIPEKQ